MRELASYTFKEWDMVGANGPYAVFEFAWKGETKPRTIREGLEYLADRIEDFRKLAKTENLTKPRSLRISEDINFCLPAYEAAVNNHPDFASALAAARETRRRQQAESSDRSWHEGPSLHL